MKIKWFGQCVSDALSRLIKPSGQKNLSLAALEDCYIYSWPQYVGNETQQCTVVIGPMRDACVYFDNQFAYRVGDPTTDFWDFVNIRDMPTVWD